MRRRTQQTSVVAVLILAMLMAWAGHVFAFVAIGGNASVGALEIGHSHDEFASGDEEFEGVFPDHGHAPYTADHVHETPFLGALTRLPPPGPIAPLNQVERHFLPSAPIALIERPPRDPANC